MSYMTPEITKYYEDYFDLFLTHGWKQFVEDAKHEASNFSISNILDEKTLHTVQGKLNVLENIIGLETMIRNSFEEIENAEKDI